MGSSIGCCNKNRGRTKSEILREDDKIEKLTESMKGGSIVSNRNSEHSSHNTFHS